jgi:peptidoglycan/LPS O-acetylase OafA/YrhL
MSATVTAHAASGRIAVLDGLRGFAVLLIVAHHVVVPLLPREPGNLLAYGHPLLHLSFSGVDLFFVLSGFFIGSELLRNHGAPNLLPVFWLRRALRIVPLGFVFVGLVFIFWKLGVYEAEPSFLGSPPENPVVYLAFASNLTMSVRDGWGFGPLSLLWSLAIEMQFYLLAPWLVRAAGPARFVQLAVGMIVFALLARLAVFALCGAPAMAAHVFTLCRLDGFGFGFLAAWTMRMPAWREAFMRRRLSAWFAWLVLAAVIAAMSEARVMPGGIALGTVGYPALAAFYAITLLLLATARERTLAARLCSSQVAVGFGRFSYFIYLFQSTVTGLCVGILAGRPFSLLSPQTWLHGALVLPLCYLGGWLSWRLFERPLIDWSHRHRYQSAPSRQS